MRNQECYRIISQTDLRRVCLPFRSGDFLIGEGCVVYLSPVDADSDEKNLPVSETNLLTSAAEQTSLTQWRATVDQTGTWNFVENNTLARSLWDAVIDVELQSRKLDILQPDPFQKRWLVYKDYFGFRLRCCSHAEGWLSTSSDGVLILPRSADVGPSVYWNVLPVDL